MSWSDTHYSEGEEIYRSHGSRLSERDLLDLKKQLRESGTPFYEEECGGGTRLRYGRRSSSNDTDWRTGD